MTYGDLQEQSNRFANVLASLGVAKGERVFTLAGRIPALYIAALGTLKHVSVFCPLFAPLTQSRFINLEPGRAPSW